MRFNTLLLMGLAVGLMMADAFTTYVALASASGIVYEYNPIARALFGAFGLLHGIIATTIASICAVGVVALTGLLTPNWRDLALGVVVFATGCAVWNNVRVLQLLGAM